MCSSVFIGCVFLQSCRPDVASHQRQCASISAVKFPSSASHRLTVPPTRLSTFGRRDFPVSGAYAYVTTFHTTLHLHCSVAFIVWLGYGQGLTSHSTHFRSFRKRWSDCGIVCFCITLYCNVCAWHTLNKRNLLTYSRFSDVSRHLFSRSYSGMLILYIFVHYLWILLINITLFRLR